MGSEWVFTFSYMWAVSGDMCDVTFSHVWAVSGSLELQRACLKEALACAEHGQMVTSLVVKGREKFAHVGYRVLQCVAVCCSVLM